MLRCKFTGGGGCPHPAPIDARRGRVRRTRSRALVRVASGVKGGGVSSTSGIGSSASPIKPIVTPTGSLLAFVDQYLAQEPRRGRSNLNSCFFGLDLAQQLPSSTRSPSATLHPITVDASLLKPDLGSTIGVIQTLPPGLSPQTLLL